MSRPGVRIDGNVGNNGGNGKGKDNSNGDQGDSKNNPGGGNGSPSGPDPPPNTPSTPTNPNTPPWNKKAVHSRGGWATDGLFETSEPSGRRFRVCGGPPQVKSPAERPSPRKPKEGEKPPAPPKGGSQIRTRPGVD